MSADIGPGSILICKEVMHFRKDGFYEQVTPGAMYCVSEIVQHKRGLRCPHDDCGITGLTLKEKRPRHMWCPNIFRPLNDGDTSLVENEKEYDDKQGDKASQTMARETEKV